MLNDYFDFTLLDYLATDFSISELPKPFQIQQDQGP